MITIRNVWQTVWGIYILISGFKGLIILYKNLYLNNNFAADGKMYLLIERTLSINHFVFASLFEETP